MNEQRRLQSQASNAESHRRQRANETVEARQARLNTDKTIHQQQRANETVEARQARLAVTQKKRIDGESPTSRAARLAATRVNRRQQLNQESHSQRMLRREQNTRAHRQARADTILSDAEMIQLQDAGRYYPGSKELEAFETSPLKALYKLADSMGISDLKTAFGEKLKPKNCKELDKALMFERAKEYDDKVKSHYRDACAGCGMRTIAPTIMEVSCLELLNTPWELSQDQENEWRGSSNDVRAVFNVVEIEIEKEGGKENRLLHLSPSVMRMWNEVHQWEQLNDMTAPMCAKCVAVCKMSSERAENVYCSASSKYDLGSFSAQFSDMSVAERLVCAYAHDCDHARCTDCSDCSGEVVASGQSQRHNASRIHW